MTEAPNRWNAPAAGWAPWAWMAARVTVLLPTMFIAYYMVMLPASMFRARANDWGLPVRSDFNALESVILTDLPNRWLQSFALEYVPLQIASVAVYSSWFALPITATLAALVVRDGRPWRLVAMLMLTYYVAMPFYAVYPLEPPWIHNPEITRVIHLVRPDVVGVDPNPYAAMPSLHCALPFAASLWYGRRSKYGRVLLAYSALVGVTVVYSGDHYVADVLAGFALAFGVHNGSRRLGLPIFARSQQRSDGSGSPQAGEPVDLEAAA